MSNIGCDAQHGLLGWTAGTWTYSNGTVMAGSGNEKIPIDGNGFETVGAGSDHITLHGSGSISQFDTGF